MKLVARAKMGDFYESFSDLIFGTLILFLVVVMALVLKVSEASRSLDRKAEGIIYPNRFTGGSDDPRLYFTVFPSGRKQLAAFVPVQVHLGWGLDRKEGRNDPVLDLCECYLQGKLCILEIEQFVAMGGGISRRLTQGLIFHWEISEPLYRIELLREQRGGSLKGMTALELRDAIGGLHAFKRWNNPEPLPDFEYTDHWRRFWNWLTLQGRDATAPHIGFTIAGTPLSRKAWATNLIGADVRFGAGKDRGIRMGETVVTPDQFIGFLISIVPGADLIVEYRSDAGSETAPPQWIEEEILFPAGFDGRVVRATIETEE